MSLEPAPGMKREPLAKSAPCLRASTKRGISAGSVEPSASSMTMKSPLASAKPQAKALPLPLRVWPITVMSGQSSRATSTVSSTDCRRRGSPRSGRIEAGEDVGQVERLVLGRDDNADGRLGLVGARVIWALVRPLSRCSSIWLRVMLAARPSKTLPVSLRPRQFTPAPTRRLFPQHRSLPLLSPCPPRDSRPMSSPQLPADALQPASWSAAPIPRSPANGHFRLSDEHVCPFLPAVLAPGSYCRSSFA